MSFFRLSQTRLFLLILAIGFFFIGAWLPSATKGVFASPDETAAAVIATTLIKQGNAIISEPMATQIPWLHPRSWVSAGPTLVPIGFLGWPFLIGPFVWAFGTRILPWIGLLLITSALYPVFSLFSRRFLLREAFIGTALLFSFPSILLYTNRGLFGNLPQLALFAWWLFFMFSPSDEKVSVRFPLGGMKQVALGALAMSILIVRPVEGIWLLPWMAWWSQKTTWTKKRVLLQLGGALFVAFWYFLVVYRTYGSIFAIGYLLRDNPLPSLDSQVSVLATAPTPTPFWNEMLPYGFHPRNIWWNTLSFSKEILWPWVLALVCIWMPLTLSFFKKIVQRGMSTIKRAEIFSFFTVPSFLALWTVVVLLVLYGSGLYADHIRPGAITIGNSFLRYLLPLVPLWIWLFLRGLERYREVRPGRVLSTALTIALLLVGVFTVFAKDDEGLLTTRGELQRYSLIRAATQKLFPPQSIILSDRSDKIFFPVTRAVSPLPKISQRALLTQFPDVAIGLFVRPLSQAERDDWRASGVVPQEVQSFGRERLYRLVPLVP